MPQPPNWDTPWRVKIGGISRRTVFAGDCDSVASALHCPIALPPARGRRPGAAGNRAPRRDEARAGSRPRCAENQWPRRRSPRPRARRSKSLRHNKILVVISHAARAERGVFLIVVQREIAGPILESGAASHELVRFAGVGELGSAIETRVSPLLAGGRRRRRRHVPRSVGGRAPQHRLRRHRCAQRYLPA